MTKLTRTVFVGISVAMLSVVLLWAQARIQRPVNNQTGFSAGISYSSGGNPTTQLFNGEVNVVTDGGVDGGPIMRVYDGVNAAFDAIGGEFGAGEFITFEGATADAFETILTVQDPTVGTGTFQLPDNAAAAATYNLMFSTLATNALDAANSVWGGTNQLIFESTAADAFEYIFQPAALTGDVTVTLPSDNATWAGTGAPIYSVFLTNAPEIANSIWGTTNSLHYEGATADAFELALQSQDATADLLHNMTDHNYGTAGYNATELDYHLVSTPVIHAGTGYFSIPPLFTHSEDVVHDSTTGANGLYVYRMYLPHPLTISDASVLLVDGGALAAADIVGIAIYEDGDAGIQLTEGTGDGTAAGLETVALADVTLYPGFYRFAICSSDAVNMHFAGTLFDDEHIDLVAGVAGDLSYGIGGNACVAGDPPATTGALATDDEAIPFIYFH